MSWASYLDSQDPDLPLEVHLDPERTDASITPLTSLADLAEALFLPESEVEQLKWLLLDKGALVLSGPPGMGKTYTAKKLADFIAPGRTTLVQFHPSYSYEDFVEGYRPVEIDGPLGFAVKPGVLREIIAAATASREEHALRDEDPPYFVLILDEINRANLSQVFGEFLYAMEYRDEEVRTQYSEKKMVVPPNLLVIGTMNSADRSISVFDTALRRRFHFAKLDPLVAPYSEILGRYFESRGWDKGWLADLVKRLNLSLPDPEFALGPSNFMREELSDETLKRVWTHSVIPYLAGRFDDQLLLAWAWEVVEGSIPVIPPHEVDLPDAANLPPG